MLSKFTSKFYFSDAVTKGISACNELMSFQLFRREWSLGEMDMGLVFWHQ
jgi:urease accessory protein UreH